MQILKKYAQKLLLSENEFMYRIFNSLLNIL